MTQLRRSAQNDALPRLRSAGVGGHFRTEGDQKFTVTVVDEV